jgi:hypothetical protein
MLHGVLNLNFKLCAFVLNGLIKGEIEKPSGPFLGRVLGDRAVEKSGGTVCGLHRACGDEESGFLG